MRFLTLSQLEGGGQKSNLWTPARHPTQIKCKINYLRAGCTAFRVVIPTNHTCSNFEPNELQNFSYLIQFQYQPLVLVVVPVVAVNAEEKTYQYRYER